MKKNIKKLKAQGIQPKSKNIQYTYHSYLGFKRDPGIPNIAPFKEEMMNALERKEAMDKEKQA